MKVLLVDDDEALCRTLEKALRKDGWEVLHAPDGARALELYAGGRVRLVISDWDMPRLDGIALCRALRASPSPLYTYFILMTGVNASFKDGRTALQAGVDEFLVKPVDLVQLRLRARAGKRILSYANRIAELEGIIPVCSYCRRLRDYGDDYLRMEAYFKKNAGVVFSHGVCPACLARHFPQKG